MIFVSLYEINFGLVSINLSNYVANHSNVGNPNKVMISQRKQKPSSQPISIRRQRPPISTLCLPCLKCILTHTKPSPRPSCTWEASNVHFKA